MLALKKSFSMHRILLRSPIALLTFLIGVAAGQIWSFIRPPFLTCQGSPTTYVVLRDNGLDPFIVIGIDERVSEEDLCTTLRKVADEHQNDPAREYWLGQEHLTVRAYLMRNGVRSHFQAATLYRYIPIRNPPEAAQQDGPREDRVYRSFWLARRSL